MDPLWSTLSSPTSLWYHNIQQAVTRLQPWLAFVLWTRESQVASNCVPICEVASSAGYKGDKHGPRR